MNQTNKPLTFDSVAAIDTGGSYLVGADGKIVRDDASSGPLPGAVAPVATQPIAEAAPGAAAELKAAAGGVPPASAEASAPAAAPAPAPSPKAKA